MDRGYDEDLSQNEFLQELKLQYEATFEQTIQEGWIICVPRSGSFVNHKFQEDEINAHILIPKQDLSSAQFNTLNGREILLVDRVLITTHDDVEYSTRLLFEETFYTKDMCKYCVWCIERPLEINMYVSDNCVNIITNLQEAVNFLQIELLKKELCADFESKIEDFLYINKDLDCKPVQVQRDLVCDLYTDCLTMLENTALKNKVSSSRHYYWNLRISLETYILYALRYILLKSLSSHTAVEDACFNKIVRNLDEIQLNNLQIRSDLQSRLHSGRLELSRLDYFATVLGKIECLKKIVNCISHGTTSPVSSDDLLPVFIFLVVKAGLSNWIAQLTFMKQFRFSAKSLHEADEGSFLITSLEAAIEHIKSTAKDCERGHSEFTYTKELSDVQTHNMTNQSKRSSIDYLFMCIEKGDLPEVRKILSFDKSDQMDDVTFCHPLCTCVSCEQNWKKQRDLNNHTKDDRGLTALHVAILYDQTEIVDSLLDHGIDVNIADLDGLTALHYACIRGHQRILLRILYANADLTVTDIRGNTPLHLAADHGHENCVTALLYLSEHTKTSVDVNTANGNGDTALHLAAKWGYGMIARILLEYGADCKLTNKKSQTPLMLTYNKYITELLEYYATTTNVFTDISTDTSQSQLDPVLFHSQQTTSENNERSALHPKHYANAIQQRTIDRLLAAIIENDLCLACYYLGLEVHRERLPDTRGDRCHPLCDCERCAVINESLLERRRHRRRALAINTCNSHGETALHVASATGRTEMVRLLLDAGANVNVITVSEGRVPLHLACLNGNVNAAKLLLNCATCNVDSKDRNGDTPLHLVTRAGNAKFVNLLIRHGANTDVRNRHNMTPLRQLEFETSDVLSANYAEILKILKRNSAPRSMVDD